MGGGHLLPQSVSWVPPVSLYCGTSYCASRLYLWTEIRKPYQSRLGKYMYRMTSWCVGKHINWYCTGSTNHTAYLWAHLTKMTHLATAARKTMPMCWNSSFLLTQGQAGKWSRNGNRKEGRQLHAASTNFANPKVATLATPDTLRLPP